MHQLYLSLLSSRLTMAPIPPSVTHILDIGTGTGEWAINMAENFQSAEVIGIDISAIQPKAVPSNVYFEIDDAQLEWTFSHQFDLFISAILQEPLTTGPKSTHKHSNI